MELKSLKQEYRLHAGYKGKLIFVSNSPKTSEIVSKDSPMSSICELYHFDVILTRILSRKFWVQHSRIPNITEKTIAMLICWVTITYATKRVSVTVTKSFEYRGAEKCFDFHKWKSKCIFISFHQMMRIWAIIVLNLEWKEYIHTYCTMYVIVEFMYVIQKFREIELHHIIV